MVHKREFHCRATVHKTQKAPKTSGREGKITKVEPRTARRGATRKKTGGNRREKKA